MAEDAKTSADEASQEAAPAPDRLETEPKSKSVDWTPAEIGAPQELVMQMSASAAVKGKASQGGKTSEDVVQAYQELKRSVKPRTVEGGMTEQLKKPVKAAPPLPPHPTDVKEETEEASSKPKARAKPTPPQPPGHVERFSGPLGVEMSSGPPAIPSLVPPAVSLHPPPHPAMSEESMKWSELKKEMGDIVSAVEKQVEAAASSSEGLAKAEEELDRMADMASRRQRPLLASELSDEQIRPKIQRGGSNETENEEGLVSFPAQIFSFLAAPVLPESEDTLTLDGSLQSLMTVNGEELGHNVHIQQEVKDETGTVVSTPITL